MRSTFKGQVFALLVIPIAIIGCSQEQHQRVELPNLIIMLADDLGYNDLTCCRDTGLQTGISPTCETPFIDSLARMGIRFTNFYCGAAVCSPSRSALLTGRNKTRLGIYNWIPASSPMHLRNEETTIAELLKQKNYATAHFGKWHLSSANMEQPEPLDQGFDYAFWTHNNAEPSHENPVNFIDNRVKAGELKGYSSHLVVEKATKWLDERENMRQPFYINIWFHEPHSKEAAPDSLKNRIRAGTTSAITGHFTDLLPTIAAITDCKMPGNKKIDGENITDVLLGRTEELQRSDPVFFYRYFHDPICMLRQGDMVLLGYQRKPKPRHMNYNEREEALFKPHEGEPPWSQWSFQKSHMDALVLQSPRYFELYDIKDDPGQYNDLSDEEIELTEHMKNIMMALRNEMVEEGGNWFPDD